MSPKLSGPEYNGKHFVQRWWKVFRCS